LLLRPLFRYIAGIGSEEQFTLSALLFSLAAAYVTEYAGLSLAAEASESCSAIVRKR
jgi:CPA2 family monovalent cation:H+ antiporter-2